MPIHEACTVNLRRMTLVLHTIFFIYHYKPHEVAFPIDLVFFIHNAEAWRGIADVNFSRPKRIILDYGYGVSMSALCELACCSFLAWAKMYIFPRKIHKYSACMDLHPVCRD